MTVVWAIAFPENIIVPNITAIVLVGHSERRQLYGESDALVARKYVAAQSQGLLPVLCVGETLEEREAGRTNDVVARQLDDVLAVSGVRALDRAVIAYEPVWAIGTGRTASPEQAQEVHGMIRAKVAALDVQSPLPSGSSTAAASRHRTRGNCSPWRTSTAASSAARRSMRTSSRRSARPLADNRSKC